MSGQEAKGVSPTEFMRQRAARTVGRQEADEHQQEDEPPGEEVSLQVFTNRIHLGRL